MSGTGVRSALEEMMSARPCPKVGGLIKVAIGAVSCAVYCAGCAPTPHASLYEMVGDTACHARATIVGIVSEGERFEHEATGYLFVLEPITNAPPNPHGWTIEVYRGDDLHTELSWAATPPYHSSNARVIAAEYGQSLEEVIGWSPRVFDFYADKATNESAGAWVQSLTSGVREIGAPTEMPIAQGHGEFQIRDVTVGGPANDRHITQMEFEVETCLLTVHGQR